MRDPFCHSFSTISGLAQLEVPEFLADSQSTPSSSTSSLPTPHEQFSFPQYQTPDFSPFQTFPWEERDWSHSITDSSEILPLPYDPNPSCPTWHLHAMLNDDSTWPDPMGMAQQAMSITACGLQSEKGGLRSEKNTPKGKEEATGPTRVERTRQRRSPYKADKGHEGAGSKNSMSQQSEIPGIGKFGQNDKASKATEKKKKKKANPSATVPPAKPKNPRLSAIRSHAKRNEPGAFRFVEGREVL